MYQLSEQKRKVDLKKEKKERLNYIVGSIEQKNKLHRDHMLKDRQLSHLIQPKEMEIMDQLGKIREEETRVKKLMDDKHNRTKELEKSEDKKRYVYQ